MGCWRGGEGVGRGRGVCRGEGDDGGLVGGEGEGDGRRPARRRVLQDGRDGPGPGVEDVRRAGRSEGDVDGLRLCSIIINEGVIEAVVAAVAAPERVPGRGVGEGHAGLDAGAGESGGKVGGGGDGMDVGEVAGEDGGDGGGYGGGGTGFLADAGEVCGGADEEDGEAGAGEGLDLGCAAGGDGGGVGEDEGFEGLSGWSEDAVFHDGVGGLEVVGGEVLVRVAKGLQIAVFVLRADCPWRLIEVESEVYTWRTGLRHVLVSGDVVDRLVDVEPAGLMLVPHLAESIGKGRVRRPGSVCVRARVRKAVQDMHRDARGKSTPHRPEKIVQGLLVRRTTKSSALRRYD